MPILPLLFGPASGITATVAATSRSACATDFA